MAGFRLRILCALALCLVVAGCGQGKYRYSSAELYYQEGQKALLNRQCYRASQIFRNMLSDFPGSHLVDEAQYGLGEAAFCMKDYVTASFEYERLLNEYPTSPFVDEARYQIGMCYYQQSRDIHHDQADTQKAIREFRRFVEDFPTSDRAPDAEKRIRELRAKMAQKMLMVAENYLKWRNPISARLYGEQILSLYADTEVINRARLVIARADRRLGKLEEALEELVKLAADDIPTQLREEVQKETEKVRAELLETVSGETNGSGKPEGERAAGASPAGGK